MRLPDVFAKLKKKEKKPRELFLSLLLDPHYISAAVWQIAPDGEIKTGAVATVGAADSSWDGRIALADKVISKLESTVASETINKVILGLPYLYLTPQGDIRDDIRPHIRELTQKLQLKPIGFVSVYQAIVHKLKSQEGVPPSVILLGVSGETVSVAVYKVGRLIGFAQIGKEHLAHNVEAALGSFKSLEVIPSRMLLYGHDEGELMLLKKDLLSHSWTQKLSFMHFPKIEVLPRHIEAQSVSYAGASELTEAVREDDSIEVTVPDNEGEIVTQEDDPDAADMIGEAVPEQQEDTLDDESDDADEVIEDQVSQDDDNVTVVDPTTLGFHRGVDLKQRPPMKETDEDEAEETDDRPAKRKRSFAIPAIRLGGISAALGAFFRKMKRGKKPVLIAGIVAVTLVLLASVAAGAYWFLPKATVVLTLVPGKIERSEDITIAAAGESADGEAVIVGAQQEKTVSGTKTVPATGTKEVGTPAKGTVTVYNKSSTNRTLDKGTVIVSGGQEFALDEAASIDAASENLVSGTVTFGKTDVTVTAVEIGTDGNLPAGNEFTIDDVSSNIAVARNEAAFTGGTSEEVTVVSRADQDALVKALTKELVDQAQSELSSSVGGGEVLIEDTIVTEEVEREFAQEVNQEASELTGTLTIRVSGTSYKSSDIKTYFHRQLSSEVPSGHTLEEDNVEVMVNEVTVNEDDETIQVDVQVVALTSPTIDPARVVSLVRGKSREDAREALTEIGDISDVRFDVYGSISGKLPANGANITVSSQIQER